MNDIKLGQFDNISNYEYHNMMPWAYSSSDIIACSLTPSNMIQKRNGLKKDTAALRFGQAMHLRFEHYENKEEYLKLVATPPAMDRRTSEGKVAYMKFCSESEGKIILSNDEWDMIENMLLSLKAHPDGNHLLMAPGVYENTFIWRDKDTGVYCKCRPDKYISNTDGFMLPVDGLIVDWKTTKEEDKKGVDWSIFKRKYYIQAAFCRDGVSQVIGRDAGEFANCFISKVSPHTAFLPLLEEDYIKKGREIYKTVLHEIAMCNKSGSYPGFYDVKMPTDLLI